MSAARASAGFMFGPWKLDTREIFALRHGIMAFVNFKPVVTGHVLVSPVRVVPRFCDMTKDEVRDMWSLAHDVGSALEELGRPSGVQSMTYVIQDGEQAGQTVPHVHIHIMPRRVGDFQENNDIYDTLEGRKTQRVDAEAERKPRTIQDMAAEAASLRKHFHDSDPISDSVE